MLKIATQAAASVFILLALAIGEPSRTLLAQTVHAKPPQLPARSYRTEFNPAHQRPVSGETEDIRISLLRNEECRTCPGGSRIVFEVSDKRRGSKAEFILEGPTAQVDEIDIINATKSAVIGRALAYVSIITIVENRSGRVLDSFYCFDPAISENKQIVAYEKIFPIHFVPGVSAEYLIYDFNRSPEENRPAGVPLDNRVDVGIPIYPPGSRNRPADNFGLPEPETHQLASNGLFWSKDSKMIAFADRFDHKNSLTVVDISRDVKKPQVWTKVLDTEDIVNVERCQEYQKHSEYGFQVAHIALPESGSRTFQLQLSSSNPICLKRQSVDVEMR